MAANLTSDEEVVKEIVKKLKEYSNQSKPSRRMDEYIAALNVFNEAYLRASGSRKTKSTDALLTNLKEFSSEDYSKSYEALKELLTNLKVSSEDYSKHYYEGSKDSAEKLKESMEKDYSKVYQDLKDSSEKLKESIGKETKDKSSHKLLLEELLNECNNRIDHLQKLKERKISLLKSI